MAFRAANLALLSKEYVPKKEFVDFVVSNYHALLISEDFKNDGEKVRRLANDFVRNKTHGLLEQPYTKNFPINTKLAIISTTYFKGKFVQPFPKSNTKKRPFYNADGTVTLVDTMYSRGTYNVCRTPEIAGRIVEIPFVGGISWTLLLADERYGYREGINWMTELNLAKCIQNMKPGTYDLYLPKFRLDHELNLKKLLGQFGVKTMFNGKLANFTGISDKPELFVSSFLNRVVFELDEGGVHTEVGADVNPAVIKKTAVPTLRFDHPFGCGFMDRRTHATFIEVVQQF